MALTGSAFLALWNDIADVRVHDQWHTLEHVPERVSVTGFHGARPSWSASMRPDFSNFLRAICAVTTSHGTGIGGAIGCLCVPASVADPALRDALAQAANLPRINAIHSGRRSEPALTVPFKAPPQQTAPALDFDRVALIEGLDRTACARALDVLRRELRLETLADSCTSGVFDLALVFPGSDPSERLAHRRPEWTRDV